MCGLVAVLNKHQYGFNKKQVDIFTSLLFVDLLRGDDSTGVFVTTTNGEVALAKDAGDSLQFIKTKEYGKICSRAIKDGNALVGHNRKATVGKISDETAHPFVVDDKIVLVHNGTLYGDHKKLADVEVDSHAVAHVIHENGDDVEAAMKKVNGAYALIWYEVEKQRLNFLRNFQRPLHWLETNDEFIWCSEKNMIDWVVSRFDLKPLSKSAELPEYCVNQFEWKKGWEISDKKIDVTSSSKVYVDPRACGWMAELCEQDSPFAPSPPAKKWDEQIGHRSGGGGGFFNPKYNKCFDFETQLAMTTDRLMSYSEYYKIKDTFAGNKRIRARAFDYNYANTTNDEMGYVLYCFSEEYPNILLRKWFDAKDVTEERLLQLASGEYAVDVDIRGQLEFFHIPGASKGGVQIGKCCCRVDELTLANGQEIAA